MHCHREHALKPKKKCNLYRPYRMYAENHMLPQTCTVGLSSVQMDVAEVYSSMRFSWASHQGSLEHWLRNLKELTQAKKRENYSIKNSASCYP